MSGVWTQTSACAFCGRQLPHSHLSIHLEQCDLALDKCPNSCGVSVQRRYKSLHLKNECPRRPPSMQRGSTLPKAGADSLAEVSKLRAVVEEERRLRSVAVAEWSQRCDVLEAWNRKLVGVLAAFKQSLEDEKASLRRDVELRLVQQSQGTDVASIHAFQVKLSEERAQRLRSEGEYDEQLARFQDSVATINEKNGELENRCIDLSVSCNRLGLEVEDLTRRQLEDGEKWRTEVRSFHRQEVAQTDALRQEIDSFRTQLKEENIMLSGVWADHGARIDRLENKVALISSKVVDLESQHLVQQDCKHAVRMPGRLVWRINDFEQKMAEAKEHDTAIHSPVFFSEEFGYKLRLEVHLNGIGHWKGRNVIVGLQVLPGEWDTLLPQPFNRKVTVVLRDQASPPDPTNDVQKILKAGTAKEDPVGFHQYIPHKTLEQHNYIKHNCIFLEVNVS